MRRLQKGAAAIVLSAVGATLVAGCGTATSQDQLQFGAAPQSGSQNGDGPQPPPVPLPVVAQDRLQAPFSYNDEALQLSAPGSQEQPTVSADTAYEAFQHAGAGTSDVAGKKPQIFLADLKDYREDTETNGAQLADVPKQLIWVIRFTGVPFYPSSGIQVDPSAPSTPTPVSKDVVALVDASSGAEISVSWGTPDTVPGTVPPPAVGHRP